LNQINRSLGALSKKGSAKPMRTLGKHALIVKDIKEGR